MLTPEMRAKAAEARGSTPSRKARMAAFAESFAAQRREFPSMALPVIDRAETGSLPAAIQLMCLDCSARERREVRDCTIIRCPLYPHRPYQRMRGKNPNDPPRK
jgi:hypothetical protein